MVVVLLWVVLVPGMGCNPSQLTVGAGSKAGIEVRRRTVGELVVDGVNGWGELGRCWPWASLGSLQSRVAVGGVNAHGVVGNAMGEGR